MTALALWFYIKGKLKENLVIIAIGALIIFDLVGVDQRYVDGDNFVSKRKMTQPFPETAIDQEINKDKGIYRVYDPTEGINGARTSYYHQSIGGYHAAKPAGLEDLFSFYVYKGNMGVLNMLNVKYVIQQDEEGKSYPAVNPDANGNAWFVNHVVKVNSANEEIQALDKLNTRTEAVVNVAKVNNLKAFDFIVDSTATIALVDYVPNHLTYKSTNQNDGLVVFSEMYYHNGWNAYVDGELKDYFKADYTLRALEIPSGDHTIEFKFEPEVVRIGSKIILASSILLGLIVLGGIGFTFFGSKKSKGQEKKEVK
ncbi:YfhO family protein [Zobellia nedashkovskayae]